MELHQKREPGQEVHIPIDEFMSIARTLETYGVDPHPVKVSSFVGSLNRSLMFYHLPIRITEAVNYIWV